MKPEAIIEAERPGLDAVILWDDGTRLIAFSYLDGRVTATRVLGTRDLNGAIREVCTNFQINDAQLTRIHNWTESDAITETIHTHQRTRW